MVREADKQRYEAGLHLPKRPVASQGADQYTRSDVYLHHGGLSKYNDSQGFGYGLYINVFPVIVLFIL